MQLCSVPGCTVMIRSQAGSQQKGLPICKRCQEGKSYYRNEASATLPNTGPCMDREEFSSELYEAIRLKAESETCRRNIERFTKAGKIDAAKASALILRDCEARLAAILDRDRIAPSDVRRVLGIGQRKEEAA